MRALVAPPASSRAPPSLGGGRPTAVSAAALPRRRRQRSVPPRALSSSDENNDGQQALPPTSPFGSRLPPRWPDEPSDGPASGASGVSTELSDWPTRVSLPAAAVLACCNLDRVCMSVALVPLAPALGWAPSAGGATQAGGEEWGGAGGAWTRLRWSSSL